jgi:hypothetical protein
MSLCCECCVLSGRGLCEGLITRPEESYRLWCVVVCDQETSKTRRLKPATGLWKIQPHWVVTSRKQTTTNRPMIKISRNTDLLRIHDFMFDVNMVIGMVVKVQFLHQYYEKYYE